MEVCETAYRFKMRTNYNFSFISMLAVAKDIIKYDRGLEVRCFLNFFVLYCMDKNKSLAVE